MNVNSRSPEAEADGAGIMAQILPLYGLDGMRAELLNRSENEIWAAGDLVFRLARAGYHSRAEIASELAWLDALENARGLWTVRPVPAQSGALMTEAGGRRVVAFGRINGTHPEPGTDLPQWFGQIGAITARLHAHARSWTRPSGFIRKSWTLPAVIGPNAIWGDWRAAQGLDDAARRLLSHATDQITRRISAWNGPFGLIHGDLRLGNLLASDGRLAVLDFDDCGFGWEMFDFAASVSFIETDPALPELAAAWLDGYRSIAPLAPEDAAMIPTVVMMRRIQLTAWLTSRAGNDTWTEFGGPGFAHDTVALARAYLARRGWWDSMGG